MKQLSQQQVVRLLIGLVAFVVVLGGIALLAHRVYVVRDGSAVVRIMGGWLPAAKAGSHTIRYSDFLKTRSTLETYLASDAAVQAGVARALGPDVEQQALERLVREALLNDIAAERNVTVSDEEVAGSFAAMVSMNSSTIPDVSSYLMENYQWSDEDFQDNVIRPAILEERVSMTFSSSTDEQFAMLEAWMNNRLTSSDVAFYLKF